MKVSRGQPANLESSKGFCKDNTRFYSSLLNHPHPRILGVHENLSKYSKNPANLWQSRKKMKLIKIDKNYESRWTSLKIYEKLWKPMKYDESHQRPRSLPGIEQRFLSGQQVVPPPVFKHPYPGIHGNPQKTMRNRWRSTKICRIDENRWESTKFDEDLWQNLRKSVKYDKSPQLPRSQPGIEQRFL